MLLLRRKHTIFTISIIYLKRIYYISFIILIQAKNTHNYSWSSLYSHKNNILIILFQFKSEFKNEKSVGNVLLHCSFPL